MLRPDTRRARDGRKLVDEAIDVAIMFGIVVLILVGFVTSYRTLLDLAATAGGYPRWLAPAVPLSFDLGIVVLSLKVARSAREGRTAPIMRLLVAGLSTATVLANASAATTPPAKLLHAVPPTMFVICFESVIITARRRALIERNLLPAPLPRLRAAQWLLAPACSWRLWRARVLDQTGDPVVKDDIVAEPAAAILDSAAAQPTVVVTAASLPASAAGPVSREQIVGDALLRHPRMSAAELRAELGSLGEVVSLRTAQRLLADCKSRMCERGSSGESEPETEGGLSRS